MGEEVLQGRSTQMSFERWLTYTVVLGLTPVLLRFALSFLLGPTEQGEIASVSVADVSSYGILILVTNFLGLETVGSDKLKTWRTRCTGASIGLLVLFAAFFVVDVLSVSGLVTLSSNVLTYSVMILAVGVTIVSGAIWYITTRVAE